MSVVIFRGIWAYALSTPHTDPNGPYKGHAVGCCYDPICCGCSCKYWLYLGRTDDGTYTPERTSVGLRRRELSVGLEREEKHEQRGEESRTKLEVVVLAGARGLSIGLVCTWRYILKPPLKVFWYLIGGPTVHPPYKYCEANHSDIADAYACDWCTPKPDPYTKIRATASQGMTRGTYALRQSPDGRDV